MIRGYFGGYPERRRPFVVANLSLPTIGIDGTVHFLVDTGADSTLLAPRDVISLGLDVGHLPQDTPTTGVGGRTATRSAEAALTLDAITLTIRLRILSPASPRQQQALSVIPSLLGRDILSHFALFLEERTDRVLLLEQHEAGALNLP